MTVPAIVIFGFSFGAGWQAAAIIAAGFYFIGYSVRDNSSETSLEMLAGCIAVLAGIVLLFASGIT